MEGGGYWSSKAKLAHEGLYGCGLGDVGEEGGDGLGFICHYDVANLEQ